MDAEDDVVGGAGEIEVEQGRAPALRASSSASTEAMELLPMPPFQPVTAMMRLTPARRFSMTELRGSIMAGL
ncbi:MAG: hypothetical protein N2689_15650 [Verrucomicrobiae bacterium]|nr:hypothetical protein [Verrucomicrobiae bacterium]